jgi:hypothetical protein
VPTGAFQAELQPMNKTHGSGNVTIALQGSKAIINETVQGLAKTYRGRPYPHLQQLHVGGRGKCPAPRADANSDGVVSDAEGTSSYGRAGATLSTRGDTGPEARANLNTAPTGGQFTYSRSINLTPKVVAALKAGDAVIVVDGLDLTTVSSKVKTERSTTAPDLPLAATAPALCGAVTSVAGTGEPGSPSGPTTPTKPGNPPAPAQPGNQGQPTGPTLPKEPSGPSVG